MAHITLRVTNIPVFVQQETFSKEFLALEGCEAVRLSASSGEPVGYLRFANEHTASLAAQKYQGWKGWGARGLKLELAPSVLEDKGLKRTRESFDPQAEGNGVKQTHLVQNYDGLQEGLQHTIVGLGQSINQALSAGIPGLQLVGNVGLQQQRQNPQALARLSTGGVQLQGDLPGIKKEDGNLVNAGYMGIGIGGQPALPAPDRAVNVSLADHQGLQPGTTLNTPNQGIQGLGLGNYSYTGLQGTNINFMGVPGLSVQGQDGNVPSNVLVIQQQHQHQQQQQQQQQQQHHQQQQQLQLQQLQQQVVAQAHQPPHQGTLTPQRQQQQQQPQVVLSQQTNAQSGVAIPQQGVAMIQPTQGTSLSVGGIVNGGGIVPSQTSHTVDLPTDAASTLYVDGLPDEMTKRELAHIFRGFEGYQRTRIVVKEGVKREGKVTMGFVDFTSAEYATVALNQQQGYPVDLEEKTTATLKISYARPLKYPHVAMRGGGRQERHDRQSSREYRHSSRRSSRDHR